MSLNARGVMETAMRLQGEGPVPVMCQLSIGHVLINTGVDAPAFNFTNEGYRDGLLGIRAKYDFDGVLLHKPGRDSSVLERTSPEPHRDGTLLRFPDGGCLLCTANDDPKYWPPEGWRTPGFTPASAGDPLAAFADIALDGDPMAALPPSYVDWNLHKGLHFFQREEDIPAFYFGAIEGVIAATGHAYSIHGEVKSPQDYLVNMLGMESSMMAMLMEPDLVHAILDRATRAACVWALAQVHHGCDAIKISSPYAGNGFISLDLYHEFIVPYERRIAESIRDAGSLTYMHTCGGIGDRLEDMAASGVSGIEALDPPPLGDATLADAKQRVGDRVFLKGNLDSVNVLLNGDTEKVRRATRECLAAAASGGGYICSSACSVAPGVPPANILAMVEEVRAWKGAESA